MGSKRSNPSANISSVSLSKTHPNKIRRQQLFVKQKKARDSTRRDERFRRKREEDKDPELRRQRLAKNVPITIDRKRTWDQINDLEDGGELGASVDVGELKRRKEEAAIADEVEEEEEDEDDSDRDSMLDFSSEEDEEDDNATSTRRQRAPSTTPSNAPSLAPSTTSTANLALDLTPSSLLTKFPTLFVDPPPTPKLLITTSLNATIHAEARMLEGFFPNAVYVPRSRHRFSYKYSLREICGFAANRQYTAVLLLKEDQKKLTGMTVVHLPSGPTFTFSISNFLPGSKIPGHGKPDPFDPELMLNGFKTPLGLLTARVLMSLFPSQPDFRGRQVVTFHNQRDYCFVRRHRYQVRMKRESEKSIVDSSGEKMKGVEDIRAGLQELGPRFTLKLRRVDNGIGRAGSIDVEASETKEQEKNENQTGNDNANGEADGEEAAEVEVEAKAADEDEASKPRKKRGQEPRPALKKPEWEWKAGMEKVRTRFNL